MEKIKKAMAKRQTGNSKIGNGKREKRQRKKSNGNNMGR